MDSRIFDLLRLLADARFHTREALGRDLAITPAGLRRAVDALQAHGLEIVAVRGRGLRLAEPFDALNAGAVGAQLGSAASRFQLELADACSSTSTLLLERARGGAPAGSVIACELQSAGRGRRGNPWQSGLGGALTFSLLWRFERAVAGLSGLSLAAGVAVARALESAGIAGVQLKWPNDLLHAGCKLGGILIEAHADGLGGTAAVIGIGINLRLPPALRDSIAQPVTDLYTASGNKLQRNAILAATLAELAQVLDGFALRGFAPLRAEWTARHAHQGRAVTLSAGEHGKVAGRAVGVEDDGALLVETARGVERFVSGELSLRAGDA